MYVEVFHQVFGKIQGRAEKTHDGKGYWFESKMSKKPVVVTDEGYFKILSKEEVIKLKLKGVL